MSRCVPVLAIVAVVSVGAVAALAPAASSDANTTSALMGDGTFTGKILGIDGTTPYPGAWVRLYDDDGRLVGTAQTNERGEFSVEGLKPGSYRIVAEGLGVGYAGTVQLAEAAAMPGGVPDVPSFRLATTPMDVVLTGGLFAGAVVDPSGRPVVGAAVRVFQGDRLVARATTGPGGRYAIPDLDPGTYRIEVDAPGFGYMGTVNLWLPDAAPPNALAEGIIRLLSPKGLLPLAPFGESMGGPSATGGAIAGAGGDAGGIDGAGTPLYTFDDGGGGGDGSPATPVDPAATAFTP